MVNTANEPGTPGSPRDGAAARTLRSVSPGGPRGLSIVVPLHNEAASVGRLHAQLMDVARTLAAKYALTCEVIYVDDGSSDDLLAVADRLPATTLDVQVVSLSRNFGKEAALLAGLDHARLGACCSSTATANIPLP